MKTKLIDKVLEMMSDLDTQEALEMVRLDIHEVAQEAIEARLMAMSEDQLLELL